MRGLGVLLIADIYMGAFSLVPTVWAWCDTTPKMGGPPERGWPSVGTPLIMRGASAASKIFFFFHFCRYCYFPFFFFLFFSERQTFRNTCPENYPGLHVILCYPVGRRLFFPFLSLVSFSNLPPCSILLCCYNHNKTKNPYGHTYIYIYIYFVTRAFSCCKQHV